MGELLAAQLAQLKLGFKSAKVAFDRSIRGEGLLHIVLIRIDPILDVHVQTS